MCVSPEAGRSADAGGLVLTGVSTWRTHVLHFLTKQTCEPEEGNTDHETVQAAGFNFQTISPPDSIITDQLPTTSLFLNQDVYQMYSWLLFPDERRRCVGVTPV